MQVRSSSISQMMNSKPPSFIKIIFSSTPEKTIIIPPAFMKNFRGESGVPNVFNLKCDEKTWRLATKMKKDGCYLVGGWSKFYREQNLELGDFLVFRLVERSVLEVDVFGRNSCEKVATFVQNDNLVVQSPVEKETELIPIPENTFKRGRQGVAGENTAKRRKTEVAGGGNAKKRSTAVKTARDLKTVVDLENGFSSVEIPLNYGNNKYHIVIPANFAQEIGLKRMNRTAIKDPEGTTWSVSVASSGRKIYLSSGWKDLYLANELQLGSTILLKSSHGKGDEIELQIPNRGSRKNQEKEMAASESMGSVSAKLVLKKYNGYKLFLPKKFARESGLVSKKNTVVQDPKGRTWPIGIFVSASGQTVFNGGWKGVRIANKLEVGDTILLKYNHGAGNEINLQILNKGGGQNFAAKKNPKEKIVSEPEGPCSLKLVLKHFNKYKITLPSKFVRESGLRGKKDIVVTDSDGRTWPVGIVTYRQTYLRTGWNNMRIGNGLAVGDTILLKVDGVGNGIHLQILERGGGKWKSY